MSTAIISGYIDADRSIIAGSGFTVGLKEMDGVCDITFDNEFDDIPSFSGTVIWNDMGHLQGMQVTNISTRQIQIVTMETYNYERVDRPFLFTAVGLLDSSSE